MDLIAFFNSLRCYPVGTLLFLVALLNLFWVFNLVFLRRNYSNKIYQIYFFYAFFALFWVMSNAFFQSELLFTSSQKVLKWMALFANVTSSYAIIGFYLLSSLIKHPKKIITPGNKIFITIISLSVLVFNFIPNLTVQGVKVFSDEHFELILGPWNTLFFALGILIIGLAFKNVISAIKVSKDHVQNRRIFYILFGMSLMYGSVVIFHIVYPILFANFNYVWLPPFLSVADVAIVGYAIFTKRFIDIRLLASRFIKAIFSFLIAILLSYILFFGVIKGIFQNINVTYLLIFTAAAIIIIYKKIIRLLYSHAFYRYVGATNTEYIQEITEELKKQNKLFGSVLCFQNNLKKLFKKRFKDIEPLILIADKGEFKRYQYIIKYFESNKGALLSQELRFTEKEAGKLTPLLRELEKVGGICIPLFHPTKGFFGILAFKNHMVNPFYSREEIAALENLGTYLSLKITGIIYNSELQNEVALKTRKLKAKIEEINELLKQQSDFIAVTAHEFRTPLSIASFQLDDVLSSHKGSQELFDDLRLIDTSLDNLKRLTEKLFAVQQYDLNKVEIRTEKVDIGSYLEKIYGDFSPIMKEKNLEFVLDLDSVEGAYAAIDPAQLRQVLHNLLTNASKFTPDGGKIVVELRSENSKIQIRINDSGEGIPDELKKTIFEKFRTKSAGAGIGLGLYLCKKIVELHKGKIWVEDSNYGGACFCLQLKQVTP